MLKSNLLTFFKTILSLDEFDETTILKTAAILDINSFEIRLTNGRGKIRAVFAETAIISHDCVPNTYHVFDDNMQIILIASGRSIHMYHMYIHIIGLHVIPHFQRTSIVKYDWIFPFFSVSHLHLILLTFIYRYTFQLTSRKMK